jgi:hypothetical protein
MKRFPRIAVLAGVLAIGAVPATSLAAGNGPSANANAYGKYCKGESKQHVKGQKGTPFSVCVTAMAKLDHGQTSSPAKACKSESTKHVDGMKGTPYSQCVSGGKKLLADQSAH